MEDEGDRSLLEDAILYLRETRYRENCNVNRKRAIRRKVSKFKLIDGECFYEKKHGKVKEKL